MGHSVGDGSLWKLTYEYRELATIDGDVNTAKNTGNFGACRATGCRCDRRVRYCNA